MIYLTKNSTSTVILELTTVSSLLTPYYLFEFVNDLNKSVTYFSATDLSGYKCRYNKFSLIETGATDIILSAGTVNLKAGSYTYSIYEATATTLSVSATTGSIISTGKAFVSGADLDIPSIYR